MCARDTVMCTRNRKQKWVVSGLMSSGLLAITWSEQHRKPKYEVGVDVFFCGFSIKSNAKEIFLRFPASNYCESKDATVSKSIGMWMLHFSFVFPAIQRGLGTDEAYNSSWKSWNFNCDLFGLVVGYEKAWVMCCEKVITWNKYETVRAQPGEGGWCARGRGQRGAGKRTEA